MTNLSGTTPPPTAAAPGLARKPWQTSTAPQFIGLFLWVVSFDQLGRRTLAIGGLLPSVLGAAVAGLLCYLLLYRVPATWGFRTGHPLTTLGTSTFGVSGSTWITGVLIGLAQVVWFAVATYYATDLTFRGLVSCGVMAPKHLRPIELGGLRLPNVLFLVTSLTWSYAASLVGHYLVRIIAALMNVFPIFMALSLAVAMLWTLRGVPHFRPLEVDPSTSQPILDGGPRAFASIIELTFGFFTTAGALSADWGAVNRTSRDVRLGGWVGVALASWTAATMALLVVAGVLGNAHAFHAQGRRAVPEDFDFRAAVQTGIGGAPGGSILLVFGLASLAPACYTSYSFGHRFAAAWPAVKRIYWTLLGATAAWLIIAGGYAGQLETIFVLMGAAIAPMVGAIAADHVRQRGVWPGARQGINPPGLVAWAIGLAVGLVPIVAGARGWDAATRFQPAPVFAFLAAFTVYLMLASLGAEAPRLPIVEPGVSPGEV